MGTFENFYSNPALNLQDLKNKIINACVELQKRADIISHQKGSNLL